MSSTPTSPSADVDAGVAPSREEPDPQLLRALADLDNLRKRYERRLAQAADEERRRVISFWLPVVDDLERASEHADYDAGAVREGVRAVYDEARDVLTRLGFERFDDVGEPFDPARHEAVGTVESEGPSGTVVTSVRPGYAHNGDTIRPARVVVSRAIGN